PIGVPSPRPQMHFIHRNWRLQTTMLPALCKPLSIAPLMLGLVGHRRSAGGLLMPTAHGIGRTSRKPICAFTGEFIEVARFSARNKGVPNAGVTPNLHGVCIGLPVIERA